MSEAKAGKYELVAVRWDEVLSKPGEPFDFKRHRRGEVVDLNVEDAARLLKAGAVKSLDEKGASEVDSAPAKSAPKADWEAYARSQGATDTDLDGVTKDDLVAAYGGEA